MSNRFIHFFRNNIRINYDDFLVELANQKYYTTQLKINEPLQFYHNLILSLLHNSKDIVMLEEKDENAKKTLQKSNFYKSDIFKSMTALGNELMRSTAKIRLQTSGTTGNPKIITFPIQTFVRQTRKKITYGNDTWATAFHPSHIGGLKVFFQAFLNQNTLLYLDGKKTQNCIDTIKQNEVSHLSATPTFYRMLLPLHEKISTVKRITLSGETADDWLCEKLRQAFPFARINNIYASSECGTLLVSEGTFFSIKKDKAHLIQINDNELYVHKSICNQPSINEWIATGDQIEWQDKKLFKIVGRQKDMVNVAGNIVNLQEVQNAVNQIVSVGFAKVYTRKNALTEHLICCDITTKDESITAEKIKQELSKKLPAYKIPRIIKQVDSILLTTSGKVKR